MKNAIALSRSVFLSRRNLNKSEKKQAHEILDEIEKVAEVRYYARNSGDFLEAIYDNAEGYGINGTGRWRVWFNMADSGVWRFMFLMSAIMEYDTQEQELPF